MTAPGGAIGKAYVDVLPRTKDFRRHLDQETTAAGRSLDGFGAKIGSVAKIAGGFIAAEVLTAGIDRVRTFANNSIEAATNLGESVNAVNRIFGDWAEDVIHWGQENANALGLSQRAFQQMATPLGAMLKNQGLGMADVTDWTIKLTERSADMASVFNTDVSEALIAIQAGLRGESDPLERFGVGLSAAKVEAEALAATGKKSATQLTEQEKALARLNLIMKQTDSASGDFRATSDGLANSQRILAARSEELQAKIGEKMVPAMTKWREIQLSVIDFVDQRALPAIDRLSESFSTKFGPSADGAGRALNEKILPAVREFWSWLNDKLIPVISEIADNVMAGLRAALDNVRGAIERNQPQLEKLWEGFKKIVDFVVTYVLPLLGPILKFAFEQLGRQITIVVEAVSLLVDAFTLLYNKTVQPILRFTAMVLEMFRLMLVGSAEVASALGMHDLAGKLNAAAGAVERFKNDVNRSLNAIRTSVTIVVGAEYTGAAAGPMRQRQHGGPVSPFSAYEVNERGFEMLTIGGRDFLLTGARGGNVTPHNQVTVGGTEVRVFIGDQELRGVVRTEIRATNADTMRRVRAGVR